MALSGYEIKRVEFEDPERMRIQDEVIAAVKADPQRFIDAYKADPRSMGGRYVCADLFKEMFPQFNESKEMRNFCNAAVHNSAAVLASVLFSQMVKDSTCPERDTVCFITGVPGAGKTSTVVETADSANIKVIYEGQLSKSQYSLPKIQEVVDAGLKPIIIAVHANPENALENTITRFKEYGRGASIGLMADIQSQLPSGLKDVQGRFGDLVTLNVFDKRDRHNVIIHTGWENLQILQSEGGNETIKSRLARRLEEIRNAGGLSEAGYRQSLGKAPSLERTVDAAVDAARCGTYQTHESGRGFQEGNSEEAIVNAKTVAHTSRAKWR